MKINDSSFDLFTPEDDSVDYYANDDMYVEIVYQTKEKYSYEGYGVWAQSYDGSLEVSELFDDYEHAYRLFEYIWENYSDTPPDEDELIDYIASLQADY